MCCHFNCKIEGIIPSLVQVKGYKWRDNPFTCTIEGIIPYPHTIEGIIPSLVQLKGLSFYTVSSTLSRLGTDKILSIMWYVHVVICLNFSSSFLWMLETDESEACGCTNSATIRCPAPLAHTAARVRTKQEKGLAVRATPGSMRGNLVCPPVCMFACERVWVSFCVSVCVSFYPESSLGSRVQGSSAYIHSTYTL